MAFSEFLAGAPANTERFPMLNEQQGNTQNQLLDMLMQRLGGSGAQGGQQGMSFEPIAQNMRQGFRQQTVPTIMERFAGGGAGGNLEGTALPSALGQAGKEFETGIGALRSQYGLQQQGNLMNMLGLLMQPRFETLYHPREPGMFEGMAPAAGENFFKQLPQLLGMAGAGGKTSGAAGAPETAAEKATWLQTILRLLPVLIGGAGGAAMGGPAGAMAGASLGSSVGTMY
jgi:hypothetical protein